MNWLFRNRNTGAITVFQAPNVALGAFLVATVLDRVFDPSGAIGTALRVVATGALVIWAADEVIRGVNPFRRLLGATILAIALARFVF